MNITEFTSLLQHSNAISKEQTIAIEDILKSYPYFQAARIIHLKGLKNQHSFTYNKELKITAAYTTNRTVLFDFITKNSLDFETETLNEEETSQEAVSEPINVPPATPHAIPGHLDTRIYYKEDEDSYMAAMIENIKKRKY